MKAQTRAENQETPQAAASRSESAQPSRMRSSLADRHPQAAAQRKLSDMVHNSPRMLQQKALQEGIGSSLGAPLQLVQQSLPKRNDSGLPDRLKSGVEALSGMSMDHVKVHYNSAQPAQLNASAYAQGSDIYVAPGQEKHLPHEAWHVVQQAQGRVQPTVQVGGDSVGGKEPLQLYKPKSKDVKSKLSIKVKGEWVAATYLGEDLTDLDEEEIEDGTVRGWIFQLEDGEEYTIGNDRDIKDPTKVEGEVTELFDDFKFSHYCQFPDCKAKKFKSTDELDKHVRETHKFPKSDLFPYSLFGAQKAGTYVLNKKPNFGDYKKKGKLTGFKRKHEKEPLKEEKEKEKKKKTDEESEIEHFFAETTDNTHSELEGYRHLPHENDKYSATTDIGEFLKIDEKGPKSFFLTPVPHCGYCSLSLEHSHLPLTYPTEADPVQSKYYTIPKETLDQEGLQQHLEGKGGEKEKKRTSKKTPRKTTKKTENRGEIEGKSDIKLDKKKLRKLPTRQEHNKRINKKYKSKDKQQGAQYARYIAQAIFLNKRRYEKFFSNLEGLAPTREELKDFLRQDQIPIHPQTFDFYPPSPSYVPQEEGLDFEKEEKEGTDEKKEVSEEKEKKLSEEEIKQFSEWIIIEFKKLQKSKKGTDELDEKDEVNPQDINNCLITSVNNGTVSKDTARQIRYLVKLTVGTPYTSFLQANPAVMTIIANVLNLSDVRIDIIQRGVLRQRFLLDNNSAIEIQGDEQEGQKLGSRVITIKHSGGNHFTFESDESVKK